MEKDVSDLQVAAPKFQPLQLVRIKYSDDSTLRDNTSPVPTEKSMGMTGIVEMEGKIRLYEEEGESTLVQVYFVRIDGMGPVLANECWSVGSRTPSRSDSRRYPWRGAPPDSS